MEQSNIELMFKKLDELHQAKLATQKDLVEHKKTKTSNLKNNKNL